MGSEKSHPPTIPLHHQKPSNIEVPLARMRLESKDMSKSNTASHSRTETSDPSNNLENGAKKHESMIIGNHVILSLKNALNEREQELEHQQNKYKRLKHEFGELRKENGCLDEILYAIVKNHLHPYAQKNKMLPRSWNKKTILSLLDSLSRDADNAGPLEAQIQTLQKEMLSKVDKTQADTDEQFAKDFCIIASLIKTISRTIHLTDAVDVVEVLSSSVLQGNVTHKHWTSRARKKLLVEACVWSILVGMVFRHPFTTYGDQGEMLGAAWSGIFLAGHYNGWPNPSSLCETWRYTTIESMLRLSSQDFITNGKTKGEYSVLNPGTAKTRMGVVAAIESSINTIASPASHLDIVSIVDKAFVLAAKMALQRFRIQIIYPKIGDKFNKHSMKPIPDLTDEGINDGMVAYVVNPGLTKWGDTNGKNLEHRYDIIPSLVLLEPTPFTRKAESGSYASAVKDRSKDDIAARVDYNEGGSQQRSGPMTV